MKNSKKNQTTRTNGLTPADKGIAAAKEDNRKARLVKVNNLEKNRSEEYNFDCDDDNPKFLFHMTSTALIIAIIKGQVNPNELAKKELANRGLDFNGKWIGFKRK